MHTLIYGASDDLIEVEGAVKDEFSPSSDDEDSILAFSDGTVLSVRYADDGCWRINVLKKGSTEHEHTAADGPDADERDDRSKGYSDRVILRGEITWVVFGSVFRQARK